MAAVAHGTNEPDLVLMEVRRLELDPTRCETEMMEQRVAQQLTSLSGQKGRKHESVA